MSRRARSGSLGPTPAQIKALLGIATAAFTIADATTFASGVYLGSGSRHASAALHIDSTTQGFLGPNMTQAQRLGIPGPAQGLHVYQIDGGTAEGDWVYRAGAWWQNLVVNSSGATPGGLTVSGALGVTGDTTFSGRGALSRKTTASNDYSLLIGDNIAPFTGSSRAKLIIGNTADISEILVGQSGTNNLLFQWRYNATAASARGILETYGGNNPLALQTSGGNVLVGTTTDAGYKLDVQGTARITGNTQIEGTLILSSGSVQSIGTASYMGPTGGAHPSAVLTLNSTAKGFLPPRGTQADRNAISGMAQGLLFYQTDGSSFEGLYTYSGGIWRMLVGVDSSGNLPNISTISAPQNFYVGAGLTVINSLTAGGNITGFKILTNGSSTGNAGTTGLKLAILGYTNNDGSASTTTAHIANAGFGQPTLTATNPQTYTIASNGYFAGPPIAGTNVTIGTAYTIFSATGNNYFGGTIDVNSDIRPTADGGGQLGTSGRSFGRARIAQVDIERIYERYGGSGITFQIASTTNIAKFMPTTGNFIVQPAGGTYTDITSAAFQIVSTTQGFLGPNMTQAQRTAIGSPAQGLRVYQTDGSNAEGEYVYRGGSWQQYLTVDSSGNLSGSGTFTTPSHLTAGGNFSCNNTIVGGKLTTTNTIFTSTGSSNGTNGMKFQITPYTFLDSAVSGTVAHLVSSGIGQPTFTATNAQTYTIASNFYITGPPIAGTNVTITTPYSLYVASGASYFGAIVSIAGGGLSLTNNSSIAQSGGFALIPGANPMLRAFTASRYDFGLANGTAVLSVQTTGNITIGTTTDDTINALQVSGSIISDRRSLTANPTTSDIAAGKWQVVKNTTNGEVRIWVNDGGTMKSALLS